MMMKHSSCWRDTSSGYDNISVEELDHLLLTLQFWGLDEFPKVLAMLLIQQNVDVSYIIDEKYRDVFPIVRTVFHMNQVNRPCSKINVSIRFQCFEVIRYLMDAGVPFNEDSSTTAAEVGSLVLLRFIHAHGCKLHSIATAFAAQHGHLDCMMYLHECGCAWHGSLGFATAAGGHLECLKYAMLNGYDPANKCDLCAHAALKGHFDFFQHFVQQRWYKEESKLLFNAADGGDVRCLKLAYSLARKWGPEIQERIIKSKSLDCFMFSVNSGLRYNLSNTALIVNLGLLEFMKYLFNNVAYTVFDAFIMLCAVTNKNMECIKYMHQCGCRICDASHRKAAELDFVEWFVFVRSVNVPISRDACSVAAMFGRLACVRALHELDVPWDGATCTCAARYGHLDVLKYLHAHGCSWNETTTDEALRCKQMQCFQYAREHGCALSIKVWVYLTFGVMF